MSKLYSIIYSTRTNEPVPGEGLMGVSKLASHLNENGKMTRGVGYFRNKQDYRIPYRGDAILPHLTERNKAGTDIVILGFTDEDNKINTDYYESYVNQSKNTHRKDIPIRDLGSIELTVFLDGSNKRRVLMTREQGMKIKHITGFSRMVYFTAVGAAKGKELNNLLRNCEPPAHNDWNAGYY